MLSIDDLNLGWSERAYVLVRPKTGYSWHEMGGISSGNRGMSDWRPAMVTGFQDDGDRGWYGTGNDQRRVWLVGAGGAYPIGDFEFGAVLDVAAIVSAAADPAETGVPAP